MIYLHPGRVLLAQVCKVLVCRLVLRVVHLDGAGVEQLRGEVLHLVAQLDQGVGPLLGARVSEGNNPGSLGQTAGELKQNNAEPQIIFRSFF